MRLYPIRILWNPESKPHKTVVTIRRTVSGEPRQYARDCNGNWWLLSKPVRLKKGYAARIPVLSVNAVRGRSMDEQFLAKLGGVNHASV